MAGPFEWMMGSGGTAVSFPATLASYMEVIQTLDQLEVIGLITIGLALTQLTLCLTLALDNYQMSKPIQGGGYRR